MTSTASPPAPSPSDELIRAAREGSAELLLKSLDAGADPSQGSALITAAAYGRLECLLLLISRVPPDSTALETPLEQAAFRGETECLAALLALPGAAASIPQALAAAAVQGHPECVRLLAPLASRADAADALSKAAYYGRLECARPLAPFAAGADCSEALLSAANHGIEMTRLLLPLSDPKAGQSAPLIAAAERGLADVVELLIPLSEPWARSFAALKAVLLNQPLPESLRCAELLWAAAPLPMSLAREMEKKARARGRLEAADWLLSRLEARAIAKSASPAPSAPSRPPRL